MHSKHQDLVDCSSALSLAEELTVLKTYLHYGSILFSYPTAANFAYLEQAVSLLADDHISIACSALPALQNLTTQQSIYTMLFAANPDGIPSVPYASYYLGVDGQIYGEATRRLQELMKEEYLAPADEMGEPADHVSCILGFASLLADRCSSNPDKQRKLADLLNTYLDPWFSLFCASVKDADSSGFYSSSADFCNNILLQRNNLFSQVFVNIK